MPTALKSINLSLFGESTRHVFHVATSDLLHLLTTYGYWAVLFFVAIERFFGRVFLFFQLQRPPLCGWSAIVAQVALTCTATIGGALAAQQAGRPDLGIAIFSYNREEHSRIFPRGLMRRRSLTSSLGFLAE